jgi:GAF domain-containing protein
VLRTGRVLALENPEREPLFDALVDTPDDGAVQPLYCVPIAIRGRVLGLARAFVLPGQGVSERTGELIAASLSAAVRNVLLYRSLLESIDDLARARREASAGNGPASGRG